MLYINNMQVPNPLAPFVSGSGNTAPPPVAGPTQQPTSSKAETPRPVTATKKSDRAHTDNDRRTARQGESAAPPPPGTLIDVSV